MDAQAPFSLHRVFPDLAEEQAEDTVEGGLRPRCDALQLMHEKKENRGTVGQNEF